MIPTRLSRRARTSCPRGSAFSYLVPVLLGFGLLPWIALNLLNSFGGAFAFEAIMKVWSQESFPTLLRSTVQGNVIAIARVAAAVVALFTPALTHRPEAETSAPASS